MSLCALLLAAGGMGAHAQWQNGGSMAGRILDGDGAPVQHARLEIEEVGSGTTYEVFTNGQGRFSLPQVAPGDYRITVEADGFAPWAKGGVEVGAGTQVEVSPRLDRELAARANAASPGPAVSAIAPSAQKNRRRWKREQKVLARLKEQRGAGIAVESPETNRMQIAEVRRAGKAPDNWVVFEPSESSSQQVSRSTGQQLAAKTSAAPAKVHARVMVRTAQGTVRANIAEVPIEVAPSGDWAAFEPGKTAVKQLAKKRPAASDEAASMKTPHHEQAALRASAESIPTLRAKDGAKDGAPGKSMESSSTSGDLPAVGSLFEPVASEALVPKETEKERRAKREKQKLQELAEAFVPARANVTETEANAAAGSGDGSVESDENEAGRDGSVASQEELQQFEPAQDGSDTANGLTGQRRDATAELDELVAPEQRSGDERLHGEAFAEDRDKAWGSQNAYTTLTTEQPDGSFATTKYQPPDRRMQYGLELGGGVAKGRGRWLVQADELTRNFPGMAVPSQPQKLFAPLTAGQLQTLAGRLGAAGTTVSLGQAQQDYTQTMGQLTALLGPVARTERQTIAFPRFDWKIDERNRIRVGYDMVRLDAKNGMRSAPTETWGIGSFGTRRLRLDAISASLDTFVTANLLNDLRYTHAHVLESEMAESPSALGEQFAKNPFGVPPEIGVASGSGGFRFGTPSSLNRAAYPDELRQEAADTLSWVKGRNEIDVGYALDYVRDHTSGLRYATGAYRYTSKEAFVADLLAPDHCDASKTGKGNLPCWSTFRQTTGPTDFTFDTADYAGFVTDTLKVTPSLTVSVGARYDYEKLPKPNAALVNPDIPETASLPSEGNLSPRAGVAWELPWSRNRTGLTTVLRGGFGIFYGRIPNTSVLAALTQTGAPGAQRTYLFKPLDVGAPKFPFVFSSHPYVQVKPDATYFATGFQHPRAMQAQLQVEQSLGRHLRLTLSYWGSFGQNLPRIVDQNIDLQNVGHIAYSVIDPEKLGPLPVTYTSKFYYRRLNANYQQMAAMESNANARYQAVGFSLEGRLSHAMALTLGYRYAHAVDDNPYTAAYRGRWDVLDPGNLALDHGTSNEDIRDRLRGGLVLHEPWHTEGFLADLVDGYTMAMTGSVRTGRPYTMRVSGTVPSMSCSYEEWLQSGSNCVETAQPGVILGVPVSISGLGSGLNGSGGGKWLPQIGRNTFRYPGTFSANMRMGKKVTLAGNFALVFQADVTNVLNHSNVTRMETMGYSLRGVKTSTGTADLRYLSGANGHAAFGAVTNANSTRTYADRQIELIMRLIF